MPSCLAGNRPLPPLRGMVATPPVAAWAAAALPAVAAVLLAAQPGHAASVLDLQANRTETTVRLPSGGEASLIDPNPASGAWVILRLQTGKGPAEVFHLENPRPALQRIELDAGYDRGIVLVEDGVRTPYDLWPPDAEWPLRVARKQGRPYVSLCEGRVLLRNPVTGRRTRREWAADLLRDRVRYGEKITSFIKEKFYRDRFLEVPVPVLRKRAERRRAEQGPAPIRTTEEAGDLTLNARDLNLVIAREDDGGMIPGQWYPVSGYDGVFAAVVTPALVAEDVVRSQARYTKPLDSVELSSSVYCVAFDLGQLELGFSIGTEHPRVGWSERALPSVRDPALPGPDGFDSVAPFVRTGKVPPLEVSRTAAAFSGGFKRDHGAFKFGDLSRRNRGSHYGFVENGVVLSRLQPGLATVVVGAGGVVDIRTWTEEDDASGWVPRFARQNGVPLLEPDPETGRPRPGKFVEDWGRGNWSGSQEGRLRTLRAGACLQEHDGRTYLIYGYFSSVTPSAMARVFEACGSTFAIHLDMNAPEHGYLALHRVEGEAFLVQRLVAEMAEVDPPVDGVEVPRYVGYSDNRDFFYLLRREEEGR